MNKTDFIKKHGQSKSSKFERLAMQYFFNDNHESKIHEWRPRTVEAYNKIKLERGDIFEDQFAPMEESDLLDIQNRKRRALSIITFVSIICLVILGLLYYSTDPESTEDIPLKIIILSITTAVILGVYFLTIRNYNSVLQSKNKRIIKGVITDIIHTKGEGPAFEISLREMILVLEKDYKKLLPGDIVSIEIFSEVDSLIKRRIRKVGNLFD